MRKANGGANYKSREYLQDGVFLGDHDNEKQSIFLHRREDIRESIANSATTIVKGIGKHQRRHCEPS